MNLDPREQLVFNFIKEWSKTHKEAIRNTVLVETFKPKLNRVILKNVLLKLMIKGYIRENGTFKNTPRKSFTLIRSG